MLNCQIRSSPYSLTYSKLQSDVDSGHHRYRGIATMTSIRQATPTDISKLNLCNLDPLTENYARKFYFDYLVKWPTMFIVAENLKGQIIAYGAISLTISVHETA